MATMDIFSETGSSFSRGLTLTLPYLTLHAEWCAAFALPTVTHIG